jgi:hypothetical protein
VSVIFNWSQAEPFDFHCPLMSLPIACRTDRVGNIPANAPYLFADAQESHTWQDRLDKKFGTEKRRIGLVWAGGHHPNQTEIWAMDAARSLRLAHFAPVLDLTKTQALQIFSLQLGDPAKQLQGRQDLPIIDLTADLHD